MSNTEIKTTPEAAIVLAAGKELGALASKVITFEPRTDGAQQSVLIPEGYNLEQVPTSRPTRKMRMELRDLESFCRAVEAYEYEKQTVLSLDVSAQKFSAILDFHGNHALRDQLDDAVGEPCREVVTWQLTTPPEAKAWLDIDGKVLTQVQFAEFLEDNAGAIVDPAQADVVEVARSLQAKKDVSWKSGQRLQDGTVDLVFNETIAARAGERGDLAVPETLVLRFPLWEGCEPENFKARLRYRINDGQLVFVVRFLGLDGRKRAILKDLAGAVEHRTELTVFLGTVAG